MLEFAGLITFMKLIIFLMASRKHATRIAGLAFFRACEKLSQKLLVVWLSEWGKKLIIQTLQITAYWTLRIANQANQLTLSIRYTYLAFLADRTFELSSSFWISALRRSNDVSWLSRVFFTPIYLIELNSSQFNLKSAKFCRKMSSAVTFGRLFKTWRVSVYCVSWNMITPGANPKTNS